MTVNGDGEDSLRLVLADHVFAQLPHDFAGRGDARKQLFAGSATLTFLVEDRLAKLDTLATDVDVARSFDQRSDIAITFATERTESVLLGCAAAACAADFPA